MILRIVQYPDKDMLSSDQRQTVSLEGKNLMYNIAVYILFGKSKGVEHISTYQKIILHF